MRALEMRRIVAVTWLALLAAGCGSKDGSARDAGTPELQPSNLFMQVQSTTGEVIPSAAVTVAGETLATDGAGRITLTSITPGRVVARVAAPGYAPASVVVWLPEASQSGAEALLHPLQAAGTFDAVDGAELEHAGVQVSIPAGALVDYRGEPVTGMVEATVVPLDPTTAGPAELPGPLDAVTSDGTEVSLESLFMAELSLWQGGLPVQLAPGARATLRFPVPAALRDQVAVGQTVAAWWLDEEAGVWREDGRGVIEVSDGDPEQLMWVAPVEHFTWWNGDWPWIEAHCFAVTVVDEQGQPVANVTVSSDGLDYTGATTRRVTSAEGEVCVDIKRDRMASLLVGSQISPLVAATTITGSGPPGNCRAGGAPCVPITVTIPAEVQLCNPGDTQPCGYSGPAGTQDVGLCQADTRTCNATGTAWSECSGQVLPTGETCATPFDDDCDGEANEADGAGCECSAGESIACYSGPAGTEGVGLCQAGMRTCDVFIGRFGACAGQIVPSAETCATAGDDDCNGTSECASLPLWARGYATAGGPFLPKAIATDAAGNVLIAASVANASTDLGGGPLPGGGRSDVLVAKLAPDGRHLWSHRFGDGGQQQVTSVAVDAQGNMLIAGQFDGAVDFGGGVLSTGRSALFAAKFDASGKHVWSHSYGNSVDGLRASGIAVDSRGNAVVVGGMAGQVNFGGGDLGALGPQDVFVAKLAAADGSHLASYRYGDGDSQVATAVAVDAMDRVVLVGQFAGTVNFGGGALTAVSNYDGFVAKLDADGSHLWSHRFGNDVALQDPEVPRAVVVDGAGNVIIAGDFIGTMTIPGGAPLTTVASSRDVFIAKLNADGGHLWSQRFGDDDYEWGYDIATDGGNNLLITGFFQGTLDFGDGPLINISDATWDMYVAKLDASGNPVWSRRYGDGQNQTGWSVATDGASNVLVLGDYQGTIEIVPGSPMSTTGNTNIVDLFVAAFNP